MAGVNVWYDLIGYDDVFPHICHLEPTVVRSEHWHDDKFSTPSMELSVD